MDSRLRGNDKVKPAVKRRAKYFNEEISVSSVPSVAKNS
jgi:hypothetical protein